MPLEMPQLISCCFTDFDELTEAVKGWDFAFSKLDCSPFQGELFQLISPEIHLGRGRFSSRLKQQGAPPAGYRTFTISASPDFRLHWRNHQIDGNHLMAFPFAGELHALSAPGFDVFTISVLEESLWRRAEQLGFQSLEKQLASTEVFRGHPAEMNELRRMLLTYYTQAVRSIFDLSAMTQRLTDKLIAIMTGASSLSSGENRASRRLLAIQKTDRRILSAPAEPPTVRDLCTIAGVSERTLEYAFKEYYNIKPKAYINALRLNGVRKQLRAMGPGSLLVADAANAWGFWHMGQFAADYRKLFGENPSATLGCDAKSCKPTCPFREACNACNRVPGRPTL